MLTRKDLTQYPELAARILGMSLAQFDSFYLEFESLYAKSRSESKLTVRGQKKRRRRIGGGRHHSMNLGDRLLVYLFWKHARPTQALLSRLSCLSRGSIVAILSDVHRVAVKFPHYRVGSWPKGMGTLRTLDQLFESYPELHYFAQKVSLGGSTMP